MQKRYYTADTLEARLLGYEAQHGMDSATFLQRRRSGGDLGSINPFDALVWADTYAEMTRLRTGSTAELLPAS